MMYVLEIYRPGSRGYDVVHKIESESRFLAIAAGDLINPRMWPSHVLSNPERSEPVFKYGIVLRVAGVEHFVTEIDGRVVCHKLGVITEALMDVAASRP